MKLKLQKVTADQNGHLAEKYNFLSLDLKTRTMKTRYQQVDLKTSWDNCLNNFSSLSTVT